MAEIETSNNLQMDLIENIKSEVLSEMKDEQKLRASAGYTTTIGTLFILVALVGMLFYQIYNFNQDPVVNFSVMTKSAEALSASSEAKLDWGDLESKGSYLLEADAQFLRSKRAQSLLSARIFIQSISILAGLCLLVVGSSFVFGRIQSADPTNGDVSADGVGRASLSTVYPGVALGGFGTLIIISVVVASIFYDIETQDKPVFLEWPKGSYLDVGQIAGSQSKDSKSIPFVGNADVPNNVNSDKEAAQEFLRKRREGKK